jgi:hypothetical protein
MTPGQLQGLENKLEAMFEQHVTRLKKEFVSRSEFTPVKNTVEKHERLYVRSDRIIRIAGGLAILSLLSSTQWGKLAETISHVLKLF